ncbi:hypothetical protein D1007_62009 [Hordeum vulgare]|nr:hypothetical protein D1007_62009 [Hordeum vulgare]
MFISLSCLSIHRSWPLQQGDEEGMAMASRPAGEEAALGQWSLEEQGHAPASRRNGEARNGSAHLAHHAPARNGHALVAPPAMPCLHRLVVPCPCMLAPPAVRAACPRPGHPAHLRCPLVPGEKDRENENKRRREEEEAIGLSAVAEDLRLDEIAMRGRRMSRCQWSSLADGLGCVAGGARVGSDVWP